MVSTTVIVAVVLFGLTAGLDCPVYTCDGAQYLPGNVCVEYNATTDLYILSPCDSTTMTCPNPSTWAFSRQVNCTEWTTRKSWSTDLYEDYYDARIMSLGDSCDALGKASLCDYTSNLVCSCLNQNCTCQYGLTPGTYCKNNATACIPGYVCGNNTCVLINSLLPGASASDPQACQGGGPLLTQYFSTVCPGTSQTMGGIPRKCSTSADCKGIGSEVYSECLCGINTNQESYCGLHYNDDPMVRFRTAVSNFDFVNAVLYRFITVNYPYIQGAFIPDCLPNVWKDYGEYLIDIISANTRLLSVLAILTTI